MPLVALWGGERVESWALDDATWRQVRATYRDRGLVMACGESGVPVERAGTRYFRHKAICDLHEGGPESREHLAAKALVAEVAWARVGGPIVEAPAPDRSWIADVLVSKPGVPSVAIEVQWAAQDSGGVRSSNGAVRGRRRAVRVVGRAERTRAGACGTSAAPRTRCRWTCLLG